MGWRWSPFFQTAWRMGSQDLDTWLIGPWFKSQSPFRIGLDWTPSEWLNSMAFKWGAPNHLLTGGSSKYTPNVWYTLIFLDHIWYRLGYVRNSRLYGGFTRTYREQLNAYSGNDGKPGIESTNIMLYNDLCWYDVNDYLDKNPAEVKTPLVFQFFSKISGPWTDRGHPVERTYWHVERTYWHVERTYRHVDTVTNKNAQFSEYIQQPQRIERKWRMVDVDCW